MIQEINMMKKMFNYHNLQKPQPPSYRGARPAKPKIHAIPHHHRTRGIRTEKQATMVQNNVISRH